MRSAQQQASLNQTSLNQTSLNQTSLNQASLHQARLQARLWGTGDVGGRRALRLGRRWLLLDDVARYQVFQSAARDNDGLLLNFTLFGLLACAVVVPVLHDVIAPKFLIAAGLLGAVAFMSLLEVLNARKIVQYHLEVLTRRGEAISFVTGSLADANAISAILDGAASGEASAGFR